MRIVIIRWFRRNYQRLQPAEVADTPLYLAKLNRGARPKAASFSISSVREISPMRDGMRSVFIISQL
jgi:hypothetical protein